MTRLVIITIVQKSMTNLIYKLKFIFSNPLSIFKKTLLNSLSLIGSITTLFSILDSIYQSDFHIQMLSTNIQWFVCGCLFFSFIISINWIPSISCKINNIDSILSVKVGDITKEKKSIIISTNTSFVTAMQNSIISKDSVQGKFQNTFFKGKTSELDNLIRNGLKNFESKGTLTLNLDNQQQEFPIYDVGTVSKFTHGGRNIYFLALNNINSSGQNSSRSEEDFYTALSQLWEYLKCNGNTEEVSIPLIASGHAGISSITKERAIKDIVESYIGQAQNSKILTKLTIYIYPKDLQFIDIKKIKQFIRTKCLFSEPNKLFHGTIEM